MSADFHGRTQVTWWAFSSCTRSLKVLESGTYLGDVGERTLLFIEVMNGRSIRSHSHFETEDEVLLLPGTFMEVKSTLNPAPNLHIIHLRQVMPSDTLLAAPFEGNLHLKKYYI